MDELNTHGWEPVANLLYAGNAECFERELMLADGSDGALFDVEDMYRTDKSDVAFLDPGSSDVGKLIRLAGSKVKVIKSSATFDYEKWGDSWKRYTTTVFSIEVKDWHTYFVSESGLWVHNSSCLERSR